MNLMRKALFLIYTTCIFSFFLQFTSVCQPVSVCFSGDSLGNRAFIYHLDSTERIELHRLLNISEGDTCLVNGYAFSNRNTFPKNFKIKAVKLIYVKVNYHKKSEKKVIGNEEYKKRMTIVEQYIRNYLFLQKRFNKSYKEHLLKKKASIIVLISH